MLARTKPWIRGIKLYFLIVSRRLRSKTQINTNTQPCRKVSYCRNLWECRAFRFACSLKIIVSEWLSNWRIYWQNKWVEREGDGQSRKGGAFIAGVFNANPEWLVWLGSLAKNCWSWWGSPAEWYTSLATGESCPLVTGVLVMPNSSTLFPNASVSVVQHR